MSRRPDMRRWLITAAVAWLAVWAAIPASAQEGSGPRVTIDKGPDLQAVTAGIAADVSWTITVANAGDTPLTSVTVVDTVAPDCDRMVDILGPGESLSYRCGLGGVVLTATDALVNTATATALDPNGQPVAASDDATVVAVQVAASAIIGDTVWDDVDGDGARADGEPGVPGVGLLLTDLASGSTSSATTNADGRYLFAALAPGTYRVELSAPPGRPTTPAAVTVALADGQTYLDADFGLMQVLPATGADLGRLVLLGLALLGTALLVLVLSQRETRKGTV